MGVIYQITSPTGRIYVGKTYNFDKRKAAHKYAMKTSRKKTILIRSFIKYGFESHVFSVIEEVDDSMLISREVFWIKELNSYYKANVLGMNMSEGGEGNRYSWMHDKERRQLQSLKSTGILNGFYGKFHSEETKQKASIRTRENNLKAGRRVPEWGVKKAREKRIKSILCYDVSGFFIKKYSSITEAAIILGTTNSSIADSLRFGSWCGGKYIFKYYTPFFAFRVDVSPVSFKTIKRPVLLLTDLFEVIAEYPSALEASIELNVPKTTINRAANEMVPIKAGYIFMYKDMYEFAMEEVA